MGGRVPHRTIQKTPFLVQSARERLRLCMSPKTIGGESCIPDCPPGPEPRLLCRIDVFGAGVRNAPWRSEGTSVQTSFQDFCGAQRKLGKLPNKLFDF